jgi:hypothetical protein
VQKYNQQIHFIWGKVLANWPEEEATGLIQKNIYIDFNHQTRILLENNACVDDQMTDVQRHYDFVSGYLLEY